MKKVFLIIAFAGLMFTASVGYSETPKALKEQPQIYSITSNAP